jgi:hypothetical protein
MRLQRSCLVVALLWISIVLHRSVCLAFASQVLHQDLVQAGSFDMAIASLC